MSTKNTVSLNELDAAKLMEEYGIHMVQSLVIKEGTEAEYKTAEEKLGFPLVMKILSDDILHKTDAGCVMLGINSIDEMKAAYKTILANAKAFDPNARIQGVLAEQMMPKGLEVLMGVSTDPQFGPIIMVGLGGIMVELLKATSLRVLPITRFDAEEMIDETPLKKACEGLRGVKYDREEIVSALLKISDMVSKNPDIREIDVNPFLVYEQGTKATGVDAVIVRGC